MKEKLLKLAKMLAKLAAVTTDKATLIYEGDLAEGVEVYVETEAGEFVPAEDGEYVTEDKKIVVKEGKVEMVETIEPEPVEPEKEELEDEPEPIEPTEPEHDEKDDRIAELEAALAERDAKIAELETKIAELEDAAKAPVEEPVKMNKVNQKTIEKSNALKYFE